MSRRRRACVLYLSECTACMSVLCLPPICEQPLRILLRGFIPTTKCAECECARVCSSASGVCVCVCERLCVWIRESSSNGSAQHCKRRCAQSVRDRTERRSRRARAREPKPNHRARARARVCVKVETVLFGKQVSSRSLAHHHQPPASHQRRGAS